MSNKYYNILWIDDKFNRDTDGKEPYELKDIGSYVQIAADIEDAYYKIKEAYNKFDLVIFDVNLENDFKKSILENELKDYVDITTDDDPGKDAGYYLYIYLIQLGFPKERLCMFTAHANKGDTRITGEWEKKFKNAGFSKPCSKPKPMISENEKADSSKPKTGGSSRADLSQKPLEGTRSDPDKYITTESLETCSEIREWIKERYDIPYYRVRRLVFQACEHWKEELKNGSLNKSDGSDIPFNNIYYKKDTDGAILPQNFTDMLDSVEMMFPVVKPEAPEKVYYQAMRIVSNFHEESAKISQLKDKSYKKYHSVIRNFRNWSAHNKFKDKLLSDKEFALLFCIALRTYFVDYTSETNTDKEIIRDYEKAYFGDHKRRFDYKANEDALKKKWEDLVKAVIADDKIPKSLIIEDILLHIGNQKSDNNRTVKDVLLGLFNIIKEDSSKSLKPNVDADKLNADLTFTYSCKVKDEKDFLKINTDPEHLFLTEAFTLI